MQINIKELPGISGLAQDYVSNYSNVEEFFAGDYREFQSYEKKAAEVKAFARPDLGPFYQILAEQNRAFGAGQQTFDNIEKLKKGDALVVATGQQVGLFTGPLYTIYKALTTIKLAEALSKKLGRDVVPVFYIVSEDHDFAEVQWAGFINRNNEFTTIRYSHGDGDSRAPVAEIVLEEDIHETLAEVEHLLPETEFSPGILGLLKEFYQPGTPFHVAFSRLFQSLFSRHGIIIFDSSDSRAKPFVKSVFEKELRQQVTCTAIPPVNDRLLEKGYHVQIPVIQNRPGLFLLKKGRHSLEGDGISYINKNSGEKVGVDELLSDPAQLSPKATIRPLVEDTLFPTIAYVGGPGEISYWAQLKGVYREFGIPMPIVVPRAGFTLIEPKIARLLKKFNCAAEQFVANPNQLLEEIKASLVPDELAGTIQSLQKTIADGFEKMEPIIAGIDPTLENVRKKAEQNILNQLNMIEGKTKKALQNKEQTVTEQLRTLEENLLPGNSLQERKINIFNYLVKYDLGLIDRLYDEIDIENLGHKIVEL